MVLCVGATITSGLLLGGPDHHEGSLRNALKLELGIGEVRLGTAQTSLNFADTELQLKRVSQATLVMIRTSQEAKLNNCLTLSLPDVGDHTPNRSFLTKQNETTVTSIKINTKIA